MDLEMEKVMGDHVCELGMGINKRYQELITYEPQGSLARGSRSALGSADVAPQSLFSACVTHTQPPPVNLRRMVQGCSSLNRNPHETISI